VLFNDVSSLLQAIKQERLVVSFIYIYIYIYIYLHLFYSVREKFFEIT
jgi:hypothetical protein